LGLRFLLDTHVLLYFLMDNRRRLTREQDRVLRRSEARGEPVALSAISLMEIAMLLSEPRHRIRADLTDLLHEIDSSPHFQILPLTTAVASESAALAGLRDPADRVIVATARVHRLALLTSDQRIIDSGLVATIA
jgi:PIN domain nuclease of toxin-antitoxin system